MISESLYSIGTPGQKWTEADKQKWFNTQVIKRSYQEEVLVKLKPLKQYFDVFQYGALSLDEKKYPLFVVKSVNWQVEKKTILVTGGVHGYETSGVQGAIRFLENEAANKTDYRKHFNLIVAPCISPWAYETINRWNDKAIDPNRSFYAESPAQESAALMRCIASLESEIHLHIDLHETTDTDNSEFRPALAARDASVHSNWNVPDGFYLVADVTKPAPAFQKTIIDSVQQVTHIAPADDNGQLIGVETVQYGVIHYEAKDLGLCMGLTDSEFVTTTEVYPDSQKVDEENCILAQVTAITAALDFLLAKLYTG